MSKMSAVRALTHLAFLAAVVVMTMLGTSRASWAQFPVKDVVLPIPTGGGPPVIIDLNKSTLPPDQQRPYEKPFDFFGLLPPTIEGVCAQVTPTYIAVTDGQQHFRVFTYKPGLNPPPDVVAGRTVKVAFTRLNNGLFQATAIRSTGTKKFTVSGVPIPNDPTGSGPPITSEQGVPNMTVKPANGVIAP